MNPLHRLSMKNMGLRAMGFGFLAVCLAACISCGGGSGDFGHVTRNSIAYVANYHSANITAFSINANTGALTEVAGSPFAAGQCLSFIAVHPSGRFAYVVHKSLDFLSDQISGYSISDFTGALSPLAGSPLVTGAPSTDSFASISFDPSGRFAYVANGTMDNVSAYSVNTVTGALTEVAGMPFAAGSGPVSIAVDPSGKFAYVAINNTDEVSVFSINPATGALTPVTGSPFTGVSWPASIAIDPSGKFAYVANRGSADVTVYSINTTTGGLTEVAGSPFAAGEMPRSIVVDPSGKYAYVVNNYGQSVSAYSIAAATGALRAVPGSPFDTGMTPMNIAVARISQ